VVNWLVFGCYCFLLFLGTSEWFACIMLLFSDGFSIKGGHRIPTHFSVQIAKHVILTRIL
jgi:hypothetical protein